MVLSPMSRTIKIFFSFASNSRDQDLFQELRKHLNLHRQRGLIDIWYDSTILAGSIFKDAIRNYMRQADIIVLLLSADFFSSEQCADVEMPWALEEHSARAIPVIPVLLRPIDWKGSSLEQYSLLPSNERPVSIWENLDAALLEVTQGIRKVAEELAGRLVNRQRPVEPPLFPLSTLPLRRNPYFTDRKELLRDLRQSFLAEQAPQTQIQALSGLGGSGKTLIAIEYVCRNLAEYQAILWLNASSQEQFLADMLAHITQLGIALPMESDEQQQMAAVQQWLQYHEQWLVVIDNLDDFSLIDQFIPRYSRGHVLIITHAQATGLVASAHAVSSLTIEKGALLLLRRAKIIPSKGTRDDTSEEDYLQAMTIAQKVEGYPLALDQAGAYIEETRQTLATYLKRYQQKEAALLEKRGRLATDHPDPVTTTLALTFQKVAQSDPNALELLRLLAFLQPDALPDEIIRHGLAALSGPLRTLAHDPLVLDDALATLQRFSLLHQNTDTTTLNMHRLVQIVIKKDLEKQHQRRLAAQAVRLINTIFPEVAFASWEVCERYATQAQHCATLIHDFRLKLKEGGLLLERLGFYYYQRGCYTEADTYLTEALHLQERNLGQNSADMAQTLNSLGLLYRRQARYQEAIALHERALELRQRILGEGHPKTAESLHNLAMIHADLGKYQQAERLYLHVLSLKERIKGPDHLDVASTLNNLGMVAYQQGHYAQAETAYQRALAIYERHLPDNHPDLIYPLDGLGMLAEIQGNYPRAEELYQQALAICQHTFGEKHLETAHSLNKLADIAEAQGNGQKAEAFYQQALDIAKQAMGEEHPDVAFFLNNLGALAYKQAQYQQAEHFYQRALAIYEHIPGPVHSDVASVLKNLGRLAMVTGDEEHAETFFRRGLIISQQTVGTTHPDTAEISGDLAELLSRQRQYTEAETLFQQALAIYLQTFGPEHEEVVYVRETYASLLETLGKNEEAASLRQISQAQRKEVEDPAQDTR